MILCTNGLLLDKKMDEFTPLALFHLPSPSDGLQEEHDCSVNKPGVYTIAEAAIKKAMAKGFNVNVNTTLFNNAQPERVANFFDHMMAIGVNGITTSPGYAYERAADQQSTS